MDVHDDHYRLWAAQRREGVNIGYPKQVPWYTDPRTGAVHQEEAPVAYSLEDFDLVQKIERLLVHLRYVEKRSLVIFWGAYPGAPQVKKERYRQQNVDPSNTRKYAKEAMKWISRNI